MKTCPTRKKIFPTEAIAEEALIGAHTAFKYGKGRGPVAVYRCEECGSFHLTSAGEMNARLARHIAEGRLKLDQEADHWLGKFKRR